MPSLGDSGPFFRIERRPIGWVYGRLCGGLLKADLGVAGDGRSGMFWLALAIVFDVVGVAVPDTILAEPRTPFDDFV
jgi:hypothetical protein